MDSEAGHRTDRFDGPVSVEMLADLQAGLLDDGTAARLRQRTRTDPAAADRLTGLDRVLHDLAALDGASAREVPAGVTARIAAALRAEPRRRRGRHRLRGIAAVIGLTAALAGGAVGTTTLLRNGSAGVANPSVPDGLPLTDDQVLALLHQPVDLGGLSSPQRRASCLGGLGYPQSAQVLGARPFTVRGRPGVLMVLVDDVPSRLDAVVVAPNCSAIDTGLLASKTVARP